MPELHVSKKTIGKLFSEMQGKKFRSIFTTAGDLA